MKTMKVVLDGYFFGLSRESDTLDRKTGEVTYSQRPIVQILVSFPAGVIGAKYELVNVTYTGSNMEEYYRRTRERVGTLCSLSVLQKFLETSKGSYLFHETHEYPEFAEMEYEAEGETSEDSLTKRVSDMLKKSSSSSSTVSSSPSSSSPISSTATTTTLGQRLAASA